MHTVVTSQLNDLSRIFRAHKVRSVYAFGSVCTDRFSDSGDIDLLISFKDQLIPMEEYADNYFDLVYKLEDVLGREVDLVTERMLRNPFFIAPEQLKSRYE